MIRRGEKWKKWRREEEEGSCSNFKHDEVVLNNCILINDKATIEDIAGGEKKRRKIEEMEKGRSKRGGLAQILNTMKSLS